MLIGILHERNCYTSYKVESEQTEILGNLHHC